MEIVIAILLTISIISFALSFFLPDRISNLEKNIENLTLQQIQETYILKQKIRILEEEFLLETSEDYDGSGSKQAIFADEKPIQTNQILKSQVLNLYRQGYSIDEISERSTLTNNEILAILQNSQLKGL